MMLPFAVLKVKREDGGKLLIRIVSNQRYDSTALQTFKHTNFNVKFTDASEEFDAFDFRAI
jgi:hypothetical protein